MYVNVLRYMVIEIKKEEKLLEKLSGPPPSEKCRDEQFLS